MANGGLHRESARHLEVFEAWYGEHRSFSRIAPKLALPERTIKGWAERYSWHARADLRDAEAARIADADAIKRRAEMLKRHRQAGELLVRRGMEYYAQQRVAKGGEAISAVRTGVELERTAEGLPGLYAEIVNASSLEDIQRLRRVLLDAGAGAAAADAGPEGSGVNGAPPALGDGSDRADDL